MVYLIVNQLFQQYRDALAVSNRYFVIALLLIQFVSRMCRRLRHLRYRPYHLANSIAVHDVTAGDWLVIIIRSTGSLSAGWLASAHTVWTVDWELLVCRGSYQHSWCVWFHHRHWYPPRLTLVNPWFGIEDKSWWTGLGSWYLQLGKNLSIERMSKRRNSENYRRDISDNWHRH